MWVILIFFFGLKFRKEVCRFWTSHSMSLIVQSEGPKIRIYLYWDETSAMRVELKRREKETNNEARIVFNVPLQDTEYYSTFVHFTECLFRQMCLFSTQKLAKLMNIVGCIVYFFGENIPSSLKCVYLASMVGLMQSRLQVTCDSFPGMRQWKIQTLS